jgi:hypothetical protein
MMHGDIFALIRIYDLKYHDWMMSRRFKICGRPSQKKCSITANLEKWLTD